MNNQKVKCMKEAKKYSRNYWDGSRKFGYGGYKYIPGRWRPVAKNLIKTYKLRKGSKILDVGCGKGFLLKELLNLEPGLKIFAFDISQYALNNFADNTNIKKFHHRAEKKFPFKNNFFDLVISLATLHNLEIFDLKKSIEEIERVGKKKYIMVESYKNDKELFNLQCWALTCNSFFSKKEWIWLYKYFGYKGDYEFIYFK